MKKIISILLVLLVVASMVSGCSVKGGTPAATSVTEGQNSETTESGLVNNTYKSGYPVVKDKITLTAVVSTNTTIGPMQEQRFWKMIEELSNIHIEFNHITQNGSELISLMFASRDYPDIMFNGANDKQIMDSAAAGDVIPLDDLMKEYAPNWSRILDENAYAKKVTTMPDGKIYSLPYIHDDDAEKGFRDQLLANVKWLDELGLEVPTTTEEFRNALRAIKANAGKGSIPENAIPWVFKYNNYRSGQYDLYASFGILFYEADYMGVENGKVMYHAVNPKIKDAIKYMHELYAEGLISSESFTDDMTTTNSKMISDPPITGFISNFNNPFLTDDIWKPMLPIKAPGVDHPMMRQQTNRVARHYFSIFSKNKYPEASMRLADILAEEEWSLQGKFGFIGEHILKTADGNYKIAPGVKAADYTNNTPGNFVCAALTKDVCEKFIWDGQRGLRQKAYDELYKPIVAPIENFYPPVVFTEEQTDRKAELGTDIFGYAEETIAHWIIDGGIDEEWDAYVKKMKDMGLEELMQIYQGALDIFNQ